MARLPFEHKHLPPWEGYLPEPVATAEITEATYPFADAKTKNPNLFPPVCLRSHWDPEQIIRRTLPVQQVATPLDPRPWTKICMKYVTSQDFQDAPRPADDVVFPTGGTVYPPTRYREAIDDESELRRLGTHLGTEKAISLNGPISHPTNVVPNRGPISDRFIQELAFPMACMRTAPYDCRAKAEQEAWARSDRLFNNTTKQDRATKVPRASETMRHKH